MIFDFSNKIYFGVVEDNVDPKRKGRIKVRVQSIFDDIPVSDIPFASPSNEYMGENFNIPAVGKIVHIVFENNQLYSPKYIHVEHYNINLQNRLSIMSDDDYTHFKSLMFNHITQIYSDNDNLTLDYKYNKITVDNENINLEIKDNMQTINIGSIGSDQDAVLGTNFFEWFDRLITAWVDPASMLGNLGAPIIKSPIDTLFNEYLQASKAMKYRSKNVKIIDNNKVVKLQRIVEPDSNTSDITSVNADTVSSDIVNSINTNNSNEQQTINESKPTRLIKVSESDYNKDNTDFTPTTVMSDGSVSTGNTFIVDDNENIQQISQNDVVNYINGNDAYVSANTQSGATSQNVVDNPNYGGYVPIDNSSTSSQNSQNVSTKVNNTSNVTALTPQPAGTVEIYTAGKDSGQKQYVQYKNVQVVKDFYQPLITMIQAAANDKVNLIINDAYRSYQDQLNVRNKNKNKPFTDQELKTNATELYTPFTSPPGFGYHIFGNSFDISTAMGTNSAYKWLCKNAFTYGFVRTVKSEYWHWEYKPWLYNLPSRPSSYNTQFSFVPKNHGSWNGFV